MTDDTEEKKIIYLTEREILNEDGTFKHRYFHTVHRFQYPPYGYIPFYLKEYNRITKKFTIVVLTDKRELPYVPMEYPCVAISEEEAQAMVEHRRSSSAKKKTTMELTNRNVAVVEAAPGFPEITTIESPVTVSKPKRGRAANDERTPIRQLALLGFNSGKNQDEIVATVKEMYPEKEEKKIRALVSLYRYHKKVADRREDPLAPKE